MRDEELERFKSDIDLVHFMESHGYNVSRRYSGTVELKGHGSKFAVRQSGNDYVFYDFLSGKAGTIIDFCQDYLGMGNLGEVRKALRDYSGIQVDNRVKSENVKKREKTIMVEKNPEKIRQDIRNFKICLETGGHHKYLQGERKISAEILRDPRFANRVMVDRRGNAIFPHYDRLGVCGYEIKNQRFTGFSPGGSKGLWYTKDISKAQKIVITESAIDAMSHAQLRKTDMNTGYVSIGGAMSEKQDEMLKSLIQKACSRGAEIVLGLDNDAAGDKLSRRIRGLVADSGVELRREVPIAKDWNDQLKKEEAQQLGELKKEVVTLNPWSSKTKPFL